MAEMQKKLAGRRARANRGEVGGNPAAAHIAKGQLIRSIIISVKVIAANGG